VDSQHAGQRLDLFLVNHFPAYSRVQLRRAISDGRVRVDGARAKPAYRLQCGQRVVLQPPEAAPDRPLPEPLPLEILYEDDSLVAVNKPPGMVVHPSKGHWSGTLAAALAYHFDSLSSAGGPTRPGIVHRLDRETSGVILVAKNDRVHLALSRQFERRSIQKEYFALVVGEVDHDRGEIEQPIGVHPYQRERMAIRSRHPTSRPASTFYEVGARFRGFTALHVTPRTGRTHQIRVHLAHLGCPVLCDRLYGGRAQITRGEISGTDDEVVILNRQALHARRLRLEHPVTQQPLTLEAPLPPDLKELVAALERWR
jgi:23S rRNA pseudouridine1911/1915/1917 synthase